MPIASHLSPTHSFEPDQLARMKQAFDAVWTTYGNLVAAPEAQARDDIALAIIRAASGGADSVDKLIDAGKRAVARARASSAR